MKHLFLMLIGALGLASCGSESSQIEDVIRARLKDPASAQFRNLLISKHRTIACIEWNSKNGLGGYGSWDTALLQKADSGWKVTHLETPEPMLEYYCTQAGMDEAEETTETLQEASAFIERMAR